MSIYGTWLSIDDDGHTAKCARYSPVKKSDPTARMWTDAGAYAYDDSKDCTCNEKAPIVYQASHINPADTDERRGWLEVGVIPNHCHPDARGQEDAGKPVWFLRIGISEHNNTEGQTVVLDKRQVKKLKKTLATWLAEEDRW